MYRYIFRFENVADLPILPIPRIHVLRFSEINVFYLFLKLMMCTVPWDRSKFMPGDRQQGVIEEHLHNELDLPAEMDFKHK